MNDPPFLQKLQTVQNLDGYSSNQLDIQAIVVVFLNEFVEILAKQFEDNALNYDIITVWLRNIWKSMILTMPDRLSGSCYFIFNRILIYIFAWSAYLFLFLMILSAMVCLSLWSKTLKTWPYDPLPKNYNISYR